MIRLAFLLAVILMSAACAAPPAEKPGSLPSDATPSSLPQPTDLTKIGPELRRLLLQRGQEALEEPQRLPQILEHVSVTIRARRDISPELVVRGARVHSVVADEAVIITADVPVAAIPILIALPDLETIEAAQPVAPASEERDER